MPGRTFSLLTLLTIGLVRPLGAGAVDAPDRFSRDVAPILVKRCLEWHQGREPPLAGCRSGAFVRRHARDHPARGRRPDLGSAN